MKFKLLLSLIICGCCLACGAGEDVVNFAKGKWDRSRWTTLRLAHQVKTLQFMQKADALGTEAFTKQQRKEKLDNVLMVTDTGMTEGQFEVTFIIGPERGTAPGFLLAPVIKDGVLSKGICIFVASYTMAVWIVEVNEKTGKTEYRHLARLNRWTAPGVKHIFKCRYSKKRKSFAVKIDNSDTLMFRAVGCEINSKVGIWGCHGTCDYYDFKVIPKGTLPWAARKP
jgi:hypothetical protein